MLIINIQGTIMSKLITILIGTIAIATITTVSLASSHREAPNISRFPTLDSSDFYMFNSYEEGRGDFVTIIANYIPLQDAYGGPNYFAMDPAATYSIHIDSDGDAMEDITFALNFTKSLVNNNEGVALNIGPQDNQRAVTVPLINVGPISANDQANAIFSESYQLRYFAGTMHDESGQLISNTNNGTD